VFVDDHQVVPSGLQRSLERIGDIDVAATTDNGFDRVNREAPLRDVWSMDMSMPCGSPRALVSIETGAERSVVAYLGRVAHHGGSR